MRKKPRSLSEEEPLEEPLINLTPLIDVVFVVLITFMLIAPILNIDSLDLAQSKEGGQKVEENSPISITVQADNSIWFKGRKISLKQLEEELVIEKKKYPRATAQLFQDQKACFGTYQSVKNIVEKVGFNQMDVLLKPG